MNTDLLIGVHDRALIELFGDNVFAVGGRVRDHFISNRKSSRDRVIPKDLDYVIVGMARDEVFSRLTRIGRVDAVGKSFGGIKVTRPDGECIEIALARREVSTGPGHRDFEVTFGPEVTILEDGRRRDITINSISVRLSDREVFAPPGALADLEAGIIRQTSPRAFAEDPLRMLRVVQFATRFHPFGFTIEPVTQAALVRERDRIATCTPERIAEELIKMLTKSPTPSVGITLLRDLGLLEYTIPELTEGIGLTQNDWHYLDVFDHNARALDIATELGGDLVDRLAALMHDIGKPRTVGVRSDGRGHSFHGHEDVSAEIVRHRLASLRFSGTIIEDVAYLAAFHMFKTDSAGEQLSDAALRRFIRRVGRGSSDHDIVRDRINRQFTLRHADRHAGKLVPQDVDHNAIFERRVRAELNQTPVISERQLRISGKDVIAEIIAAGVRPPNYHGDRLVGNVLSALLERVTDDPSLNTESTLRGMIPHHLTAV